MPDMPGAKQADGPTRAELVDIVRELVRHDTVNPPGNEHRVKDYVAGKMRELGMAVSFHEKEPGRTNVVGRIGKGSPSLGFVSHMDVVPPGPRELWKTDPFDPVIKQGRIFGRGTLDDKGSFACAWGACKTFLAANPAFAGAAGAGTLYLVAAADEEMGSSLGIIYLVKECGLRFDVAIIPDGGNMNVSIYGEKGILWVEVESLGIQAHGSTPELGRNAIEPMADFITRLRRLDLGRDFDRRFDGWSLNVGTIEGGSSTNTVPASCKVSLDLRVPKGIGKAQVLRALRKVVDGVRKTHPKARFRMKVSHESKPHISPRHSAIMSAFDGAAKKLKIPMAYTTFGGNTVAKDLYFAGILSVVHYPGDDRLAHVPNEYVRIADLELGTALYAGTLAAYFGGKR
jgi:succinyl-diaminopimelate desuccinylase